LIEAHQADIQKLNDGFTKQLDKKEDEIIAGITKVDSHKKELTVMTEKHTKDVQIQLDGFRENMETLRKNEASKNAVVLKSLQDQHNAALSEKQRLHIDELKQRQHDIDRSKRDLAAANTKMNSMKKEIADLTSRRGQDNSTVTSLRIELDTAQTSFKDVIQKLTSSKEKVIPLVRTLLKSEIDDSFDNLELLMDALRLDVSEWKRTDFNTIVIDDAASSYFGESQRVKAPLGEIIYMAIEKFNPDEQLDLINTCMVTLALSCANPFNLEDVFYPLAYHYLMTHIKDQRLKSPVEQTCVAICGLADLFARRPCNKDLAEKTLRVVVMFRQNFFSRVCVLRLAACILTFYPTLVDVLQKEDRAAVSELRKIPSLGSLPNIIERLVEFEKPEGVSLFRVDLNVASKALLYHEEATESVPPTEVRFDMLSDNSQIHMRGPGYSFTIATNLRHVTVDFGDGHVQTVLLVINQGIWKYIARANPIKARNDMDSIFAAAVQDDDEAMT